MKHTSEYADELRPLPVLYDVEEVSSEIERWLREEGDDFDFIWLDTLVDGEDLETARDLIAQLADGYGMDYLLSERVLADDEAELTPDEWAEDLDDEDVMDVLFELLEIEAERLTYYIGKRGLTEKGDVIFRWEDGQLALLYERYKAWKL